MDVRTNQVRVGFRTPEGLAKGKQVLRDRDISNFRVQLPPNLDDVPEQRRPDTQSGLPYAAALGGVAGAGMGVAISAMATSLPNLPSLEGSTTELFVLVPLGGALLGAIAGGLFALLSGANPREPDITYYEILLNAASKEVAQEAVDALIGEGGRLL